MNTSLLPAEKDPMGAAIADFYHRQKADRLRVFSSQFDEDEIPVKQLFRKAGQMPLLERTALAMATGTILDVGAGSGCHALALQESGKEVSAIDISPLSVEVMKLRGVKDARQVNLFDERFAATFDTILMDSSDLRYLFEDEDGSFLIDLAGDYYGEIDFRMQYKDIQGDPFDWLYIDFQTLSAYAADNGFKAEMIKEGKHYDYLARLTVAL